MFQLTVLRNCLIKMFPINSISSIKKLYYKNVPINSIKKLYNQNVLMSSIKKLFHY